MADIFREIDEELREERYAALWKKHSRKVLGAALLLVVGTAAFVAWQDWQRRQAEELGARYAAIVATAATDKTHAEKDLDALADNGASGYRLLARFQAALLRVQGDDKTQGLAGLAAIAADSSVDQSFRDLALVLSGIVGVDNDASGALSKSLTPLTVAPDAWRFSALELVALADIKAGNRDAAAKIYQQLADDLDAPPSLRARAAEIIDAFHHQG